MLPKSMINNIGYVIVVCILVIGLALFLQFYLNIKVENFVEKIRKKKYRKTSKPPTYLVSNNPNLREIKRQMQKERRNKLMLKKNDINRTFDFLDKKIKQKKTAMHSQKPLAVEFKKKFDKMVYDDSDSLDQYYKNRLMRRMQTHKVRFAEINQLKDKTTMKPNIKKYVPYSMPQEVPIRYVIKGDKMVLVDGYFKKSDITMMKIPAGYKRDPKNEYNIIPLDNAMKGPSIFEFPLVGEVPKKNQMMKDGYYKINDTEVGLLPPGKKPNIANLEIDTSKIPHRLIYYYGNGYVDESEYYFKQYTIKNNPRFLPSGVYFVDPGRKKISLLPYGKIADNRRGFGYMSSKKILNPKKPVFNVSQKRLNNYKAEFHERAETILKKQDADKQGPMVIGPNGKMIQLPKVNVQGSPIYYKAGQYPYGGPSYVPTYEDSIYGTKSFRMPTEIYQKPL